MSLIVANNLKKEFKIRKVKEGALGAISSLFSNKFEVKPAVNNISFEVQKGEIVGYIGPNGAGKSTTIKMLTGILTPSAGQLFVNGYVPHRDRKKYTKSIGVVFGQRTQLWWDLSVIETFKLLKQIYEISDNEYNENLHIFNEVLGIDKFDKRPVRSLSLGQRMRCDIAASLLHNPEILFLDEPTIGLDIIAKESIRKFIKHINEQKKVTIILTTHDMSDIEELCKRIIIIDGGNIVFDGELAHIRDNYSDERIMQLDLDNEKLFIGEDNISIIRDEGKRKWISFKRSETSAAELIQNISKNNNICDLSIESIPIENIIAKIYDTKN